MGIYVLLWEFDKLIFTIIVIIINFNYFTNANNPSFLWVGEWKYMEELQVQYRHLVNGRKITFDHSTTILVLFYLQNLNSLANMVSSSML